MLSQSSAPFKFAPKMKGQLLYGLGLSNNATDAVNDIDIAAGAAVDDTGVYLMELTSGLTKQLDAAFTAGDDAGGLDTGSAANNPYYVFLILNPSSGAVDVLFSASASSPTMPSGYTVKKYIGAFLREGGSIVGFVQTGKNIFRRKVPVTDINVNNSGTSAVLRTLSVPANVIASLTAAINNGTNNQVAVLLTATAETDTAPSGTLFTLQGPHNSTTHHEEAFVQIPADSSRQIRSRQDKSGASDNFMIMTHGWIDPNI
ncbi:MAG: hypothetical protein H6863_06525 [Rhodospirillales bacterium]|nr:hypothetical protein [Rhodospirillales bacterium]